MTKSLQELANDGLLFRDDESELIIQNLFSKIVDAKLATAAGRQVVDVINMADKKSSTLDIDLEDVHTHNFNRVVAEGAPYPLDAETYTKVQVTAKKYGHAFGITDEMVEDANWNLIERRLRNAGAEMARKEDALITAAFDNSTTGIASETNHAITSTGTELGINDLLRGRRRILENNYNPTVAWINPTQEEELLNLDTFVEADKVGNRQGFERGLVGKFAGMMFLRNNTISEDTTYVLDPMNCGILAVRKPMFVEQWRDPLRDLTIAKVGQRMASRVLRPKAGAAITVQ